MGIAEIFAWVIIGIYLMICMFCLIDLTKDKVNMSRICKRLDYSINFHEREHERLKAKDDDISRHMYIMNDYTLAILKAIRGDKKED